jgi:hypothetical protein
MWETLMQRLVSKTVIVVTAALLTLSVTGYLLYSIRKTEPDPPRSGGGFRDEAEIAGITFRMAFLPNEQGEKFKINLYDHGCGVAVGDYDGDGHDDIYFCNQLGRNALYRNRGDGTFEDVTEKAGVGLGDRICVAATFGDYLNEGRQSLYVTSTRGGNVLFRNMGDGTFKDVTREAGLTLVAHSQTATFFDYDGDGYLDLFVTNTAKWTLNDYNKEMHYYPGLDELAQMVLRPKETNVLYHNNRDGTFTDVTEKAGLMGKGWGGDVAVFDYNGDGKLDLLVTNMFGPSQLYRNNGDGTFTNVTKEVLGRISFGPVGCKAFDFNNDGRLDLFLVDMHSDMWMSHLVDPRKLPPGDLKKKYPGVSGMGVEREVDGVKRERDLADLFKIRYDEVIFGNTFYKALPGGRFEELSDRANLETWWPWGLATGDFDNDGFEDVFIASGMGYPYFYWPNALLMNNGDETFTDRASQFGIEPPPGGEYFKGEIGGRPPARSSRCVAVADFDGDGRLDLIVNNFNDMPYYFRNHLPRKNYVAFRLTGTKSNRDAIGAMVWLYTGQEVMVRQVHAAGGYLSQSSKTVHFGLGERQKIDRVEIRWPSGLKQEILAPAINTLHPVKEQG